MTVAQTSLFGGEEPLAVSTDVRKARPERPLTERQQFVLELLQNAGPDGLTPDDVGRQLHGHQGKHSDEELCQWCPVAAREVLRALRNRGKVKSRRTGSWYALDGVVRPSRPGEGIPF